MEFIVWLNRALHIFNVLLIVSELVFCLRLPKRRFFAARLLVIIPYLFVFNSSFSGLIGLPSLSQYLVFEGVNLSFLFVFAVSLLMIWFMFDVNFWKVLFYCSAAYSVQHIVSYTRVIIFTDFLSFMDVLPNVLLAMAYETVCMIAVYFTIVRRHFRRGDAEINNKSMILFSAVMLLLISILSGIVNLMQLNSSLVMFYSALVSALLLVILFSTSERLRILNEKNVMEKMFGEQAKQRETYEENIAVLNMKYHDLRHTVNALKDMGADDRQESIRDVEKVLAVYDSRIETDNNALNTVLREKSIYCERVGIQFVCSADGSRLDFMSSVDIYALFGNALDNAIEAVIGYAPTNRVVYLKVANDGDFVRINVENYFDGVLTLKNGLPVTTKKDDQLHGYGTRSMKYLADKYGGTMHVAVEDNWYKLSFLFVPERGGGGHKNDPRKKGLAHDAQAPFFALYRRRGCGSCEHFVGFVKPVLCFSTNSLYCDRVTAKSRDTKKQEVGK